jgi:hypothetical protein
VTLTRCTVTLNHATLEGGGVFQFNTPSNHPFSMTGSILAGNTTGGDEPDLVTDGSFTISYSILGINPMLAPLADNGGPTMTHALLPGSPAIDTGNPGIAFNPAEYDQRGAPFVRVFDGNGAGGARIDMGSFELIPSDVVPVLFGDYNRDGIGDAADFVMWRKMVDAMGIPPYSGADGNGDGTIDQDDVNVWHVHFGEIVPAPPAESGADSAVVAAPIDGEQASAAGSPPTIVTQPKKPEQLTSTRAHAAEVRDFALAAFPRQSSQDEHSRFGGRRIQHRSTDFGSGDLLLVATGLARSSRQPTISTAKSSESNDQNTDDLTGLADAPLERAFSAWRERIDMRLSAS